MLFLLSRQAHTCRGGPGMFGAAKVWVLQSAQTCSMAFPACLAKHVRSCMGGYTPVHDASRMRKCDGKYELLEERTCKVFLQGSLCAAYTPLLINNQISALAHKWQTGSDTDPFPKGKSVSMLQLRRTRWW